MPFKSREARNAWRRANEKPKRSRPRPPSLRPFVAVDGEGGGVNEHRQQNYLLLRAGDQILFCDNRRLTTIDCLDFLSALPTRKIYVAYYFDYDVTQILRDVPEVKLRDLFARSIDTRIDGKRSDTILFGDFELGYFPRKHFKVRRIGTKNFVTIHDVGTFFQCSFVQALTLFEILSPEERAAMAAMKNRRSDFSAMTADEIEYNRQECDALVLLMDKFRGICKELGYLPRQWEGPGQLAAAMMKKHNVTRRSELKLPIELLKFANDAYYGGRFETMYVGLVKNVYQYDIASAYPSSYLGLPCLEHGEWHHGEGSPPADAELYVASLQYSHDERNPIVCHLPHRVKSGGLVWQRDGNGVYWNGEIEAACAAGTIVKKWHEHWWYEKQCDCQPFTQWVRDAYAVRLAVGKSTKGYPLKLALNSIYGKCCQSIGVPPFANPIWGGLITSYCRTRLIEAYAQFDPKDVVMLATDGLYTKKPLRGFRIGKNLGDWEDEGRRDIFIVKPGFYFGGKSSVVKTRGVSKAEFATHKDALIEAWRSGWSLPFRNRFSGGWPSIEIERKMFVGTRLGLHRNAPQTIGVWTDMILKHSFSPVTKRRLVSWDRQIADAGGGLACVATSAKLGGSDEWSIAYHKMIGGIRERVEVDDKSFLRAIPELAQYSSPAVTDAELESALNEMQLEGLPSEKLFDLDDVTDDDDLLDL